MIITENSSKTCIGVPLQACNLELSALTHNELMVVKPKPSGEAFVKAPRIPDHTLLRLIGSGSYGEVWLAQNILGAFRAVKVICRQAFEHDRPFEREFQGIQKYEPISRSHESQVSILHIGRNADEEYYFYVMELADDASVTKNSTSSPARDGSPLSQRQFDPANYLPRTLRHEIRQQNRLPVEECLKIGLSLTSALDVLHQNGLVHRDVKPSNIIFINGVPKLADIGLVTSVDATRSVVGTIGYLPPEGAGAPQADLYSLGKVLYEASTGQDCCQFPELPSDLRAFSDRAAWIEFNEIILKACAAEVGKRYRTVREMRDDLLLLQRGKSIKKKYALRQRATTIGGAVVAATILILVAFGIRYLFQGRVGGPESVPRTHDVRGTNAFVTSPLPKHDGPTLRLARTLELPGVLNWSGALIGQWSGYQEPLLFLPIDQKLVVVSSQGYRIREKLLPLSAGESLGLSFVSDLDGDHSDEAIVSWRSGKDLFVSVLNANLFEIKRFKTQGEMRPGKFGIEPVSGMWAKRVTDLHGDGRKQMLTFMGTAYTGPGPKPRKIICFDYEKQTQLWEYETGPFVIDVETVDLDGDGVQEIIVGTEALSNGNKGTDETDDDHSYVYALKADGSLLWKKQLGGFYTRTYPLIITVKGDNAPSVLVWIKDAYEFRKALHQPENAKILRFNAQGEALKQYDAGVQLVSCRVVDLHSNGKVEVLAADREGFLHVLDSRLDLIAKVHVVTNRFDRVRLEIAAVADLDNDGKLEVIATSLQEEFGTELNSGNPEKPANSRVFHENSIIVLNSKLQPVARYVVADRWTEAPNLAVHIADLSGHKRLDLLSLADKALVLEYQTGK